MFKLGTRYSKSMNLNYLTAEGKEELVVMGSYGIGLERLMATIVEQNHDQAGIVWPESVAPFAAHLIAIGKDERVYEKANVEYQSLLDVGINVLFDDRQDKTAGEKFADADLIGIPIRLVLSEKTLAQDSAEIKKRSEKESQLVKLDDLLQFIKEH